MLFDEDVGGGDKGIAALITSRRPAGYPASNCRLISSNPSEGGQRTSFAELEIAHFPSTAYATRVADAAAAQLAASSSQLRNQARCSNHRRRVKWDRGDR